MTTQPTWAYRSLFRVLDNTGRWTWSESNKEFAGKSVDETLNKLGADGWELVTVMPMSSRSGTIFAGETSSVQYFLKKPSG